MEQTHDSPLPRLERQHDPDPEIDALLDFDPVYRRIKRSDGWPPDVQRGFIAALARTGSVEHAAFAVHRSDGGAWKLRGHGSGQSFAAAWDGAVDLYHRRNPKQSRRGGRARGAWTPGPEPEPEPEPDALWALLEESIFGKYVLKLNAERDARLSGRIGEADFIVRQLTWLEVTLDLAGLGEKVVDLYKGLSRGERNLRDIVATPMSVVLDTLRRAYWEQLGEPERPPLPPLGRHDDESAAGQPLECQRWPERDGEGFGPSAKREAHLQKNADAQRLWEEKARADAEAWRARVAREGGEHPKEQQP
jgi:hypothetical protein